MATTPPARPDTACSQLSRALGEPFAGTAATATTWLCLEQPGPWGREAVVDSHLDHAVGAALAAATAGTGVRVVLIRRPGRHPDRNTPRQVYLAHTRPGATSLRQWTVAEAKDLLDLDFPAVGAGEIDGHGDPCHDRLLLVCTNGRRDVCCAVAGRPLAADLAVDHPGAVWECSHIGGHRFAPTALLLPTGYSYGALDTDLARALLTSADVVTDRCRGRSCWPAAAQAAELAVRDHAAVAHPDALTVADPLADPVGGDDARVAVTHVDGRHWSVSVRRERAEPPRPASCGAALAPAVTHTAHHIT